MHIEWPGKKCILCLGSARLTIEHIIPASIGGNLTSNLLCKNCNSALGAKLEPMTKSDPSIRIAAVRLQTSIPDLANQLKEGQEFVSEGPGGKKAGIVKNGEFNIRPHKADDGSLIQSSPMGKATIRNILTKAGHGDELIREAIQRFNDAPENERIPLAGGIETIKWPVEKIDLDLSKCDLLNSVIPLKIAYEFLACHVGTAICDEEAQLDEIRDVILNGKNSSECFEVERLNAERYEPFHGIYFEGNDPYSKVLIRLFGQLAFRVHLRYLAIGGDRCIYTQNLETKLEDIRVLS
ncbi:MAG: HNH endonuclease [Gammaproteobacteria bacterium]|nr:HNH endonuclease [Gammaproteobacteria bacterium]